MSIDRPENLRDFRRIIIGIDPGTNVMGYGVLGVRGRQPEVVALGALRFKAAESHYLRLRRIHEDVLELVARYLPDEMAIEAPFFGKNVQSMLKLGRAQGVAMVAALVRDIPVTEYEPRKIKQSITGNGAASKEQVQEMLRRILNMSRSELPRELDATDALAAALCHYYESDTPRPASGPRSWKEFVAKNPGKVSGL
ncbi:MAG: crossover junction endodeoxyribonuclease RuvC [Muribaculaceae bacterium]|nr:crossover junction endodeoxyribonuclease RuvC [Muribaculaceae bacterium]MBP3638468.1 crossover junction endodeoxyribonuclease RuvC [Muribaculaceae bacterium]